MGALRYSHPQWMHDASSDHLCCPVCKDPLQRRRRKSSDRFLSLIFPVRRYACARCSWTGVRRRPDTAEVTAQPWSPVFVVSMVIVLMGVLGALGMVMFELMPGMGLEVQRFVSGK